MFFTHIQGQTSIAQFLFLPWRNSPETASISHRRSLKLGVKQGHFPKHLGKLFFSQKSNCLMLNIVSAVYTMGFCKDWSAPSSAGWPEQAGMTGYCTWSHLDQLALPHHHQLNSNARPDRHRTPKTTMTSCRHCSCSVLPKPRSLFKSPYFVACFRTEDSTLWTCYSTYAKQHWRNNNCSKPTQIY